MSIQPNLDESAWSLTGRLPGFVGRTLVEALEAKADTFPYGPTAHPSRLTRHADVLWAIAEDSLHGGDGATTDTFVPVVSVFVGATETAAANGETGITIGGEPHVGRHTLEAVLCDGIVEVTARSQDGTPLAMGRRSRVIPPRLRRFILHRDGGFCTTAGCVSRCRVQAHHMVPWSEGGRTDPENLTTLCWFHHHVVVHGHGFTLDPATPPQRRRLTRPRIHAPPRRTGWRVAQTS